MISKLLSNSKLRTACKLVVTSLFLSYLFFTTDIGSVVAVISRISLWYALLSFFVFLSTNFTGAFRWKLLLKSKNFNLPTRTLIRYYFIGTFFNLFLPTVVGGDIARGYYLYSSGVEKKVAISSIIFERIQGLVTLMLIILVSIVPYMDLMITDTVRMAVIFSGLGVLAYVLVFHVQFQPFFGQKTAVIDSGSRLKPVINLIRAVKEYHEMSRTFMYSFLISILHQMSGIISAYLMAVSIGISISFIYFLMFLPIIRLVSMIPISINGLGLREGTFVFLFASIGMSREVALAISILLFIQIVVQGVIGSILYLSYKSRISLKHFQTTN